jgi:hypothetical protein
VYINAEQYVNTLRYWLPLAEQARKLPQDLALTCELRGVTNDEDHKAWQDKLGDF